MDANTTTATDSTVAEAAEAAIAAAASSEAVSGFPIEPIKILGKKAYPLEETLRYFDTLRSAYDTLQGEHTEATTENRTLSAEVERERQQVLDLRLELKATADSLEAATAEKNTVQNEISRMARATQQKDLLMDSKEADRKKLEADLADKTTAASRYADEVAELKKKNAKLEESVKLSVSKLEHNTMRQQLEEKVDKLKAQKAELENAVGQSISPAEHEELKIQLAAEVAVREAIIEANKSAEAKAADELAAKDAALASKTAEIVECAAVIVAKESEISALLEEIAARNAEIERLAEHQYEIVEGTEIMALENNNTLIPAEFAHKIVNIFGPAQMAASNYVLEVQAQMDTLLANAQSEADEKIAIAQRQHDEIVQSAQAQAEELISEATIDADAKRQKADSVLSKARENAAQVVSDAEFRAGEEKAAAQKELETIEALIASASARYQKLNAEKVPTLESGAQEQLG